MGQIGKELREVYVEPLENPVPKEVPVPVPTPQELPVPQEEPVKVPA
jgi:hypothetical protein